MNKSKAEKTTRRQRREDLRKAIKQGASLVRIAGPGAPLPWWATRKQDRKEAKSLRRAIISEQLRTLSILIFGWEPFGTGRDWVLPNRSREVARRRSQARRAELKRS